LASGRFLLDTNIVIALFAEDPEVKRRVSEAAEVFASIVVLGELYYGARKSARVESNLRTVDEFAAANRVLGCDSATAHTTAKSKIFFAKKVGQFRKTTSGLPPVQDSTI
jgi:tRNA(fMet)-specific endonuclease VapC